MVIRLGAAAIATAFVFGITGCRFTTEVRGTLAVDACQRFREGLCAKFEECLETFDEPACAAGLEVNGKDCSDISVAENDVDGCIEDFLAASCDEAVDGTTALQPGRCEDVAFQ